MVALATYAEPAAADRRGRQAADRGGPGLRAATSIVTADFFVGSLCYLLTSFLAITAFHRQQWGWIFIVWNCVSLALGMVLSVILFHEPITIKRAAASLFVFLVILLSD